MTLSDLRWCVRLVRAIRRRVTWMLASVVGVFVGCGPGVLVGVAVANAAGATSGFVAGVVAGLGAAVVASLSVAATLTTLARREK